MILSASAISTAFKKVSLTTAGIASVMALGTAGANAVILTPIVADLGPGQTQTIFGTFTGLDTLILSASGTVDNSGTGDPDVYTTNAAGIVTASNSGFEPGTVSQSGFGTFNSGALLIGNDDIGFKQAFASDSSNGLGNPTPITSLTRTITLADLFDSALTTTNSLQFKIEPAGFFNFQTTTGGSPSSVSSFSSVPNVYTLNGVVSHPDLATDVPEPFTIVGTLIGGTAALRMRKKLKANHN